MLNRHSIIKDNETQLIEIHDHTVYWGKAVLLKIEKDDGTFIGQLSYSCHPEFNNFEFYQNKTIEELAKIALENYASIDFNTKLKLAFKNKMTLCLRFNN